MINVSVIGVGYWGPNLIRNFVANPQTNIEFCCDLKEERLKAISKIAAQISPVSIRLNNTKVAPASFACFASIW